MSSFSNNKAEYLEVASVTKPHGVRGELKLFCLCDSPDSLRGVKNLYTDAEGKNALSVKSLKNSQGFAIVGCLEIGSVEEAETYRGKTLYAHRDDIKKEEGAFFVCDLLGLSVIDADSGKVYGTLGDIFPSPASDIYAVKTDRGEVLVPAVPQFIKDIDLERGIFITPISGMFDQ